MMTDADTKLLESFTKYDKNGKGTSRRILATNTCNYSDQIDLAWIVLAWLGSS